MTLWRSNDAVEVLFGLRLLDKALDHVAIIIIPVLTKTCNVGQVTKATLSKRHP